MSFEKAQFDVEGDHLHFGMPITKVNEEKREVSGFATLDNVDSQGDVVTAEASKAAFAAARGNIREMHQSSAVGRLKNFVEKTYYDKDGTPYTGIYVTVHISKGAQDAWEKVLDGTYSGFSIGGNITDAETQWVKDANKNVRFVKSYDLVELSIVDNPANQLSNVFSIHKSAEGTMIKGMIAETAHENVFYCATDGISDVAQGDEAECPVCKNEMSLTGGIDSDSSVPVNEQVAASVKKFLGSEGGTSETMTDTVNKSEEVVENDETSDSTAITSGDVNDTNEEVNQPVEPEKDEAGTENDKETDKVEEVDETPENDLEKVLTELREVVQKSADDSREIAEEASRKVEEEIAKVNTAFETQISEVNSKFEDLSKKLDAVKAENAETRKSLEVLTGSTAFKKSGEVESPNESQPKGGTFGGVFLASTDDL